MIGVEVQVQQSQDSDVIRQEDGSLVQQAMMQDAQKLNPLIDFYTFRQKVYLYLINQVYLFQQIT